MNVNKLIENWKAEEQIAHIHGWDFSHINGRCDEGTDLPWDYKQVIQQYLRDDMNILDYLVGNTDRHQENWGFLIDNTTNQPISLYPLMDFNMSFQTYDKLDGANCLTVGSRKLSQREAAIEAVKAIGLRQICDVDMSIFEGMGQEREMFKLRLAELKKYAK